MKYFVKCLKNYANFTGRARRKEYWMFVLFFFLIGVAFSFAGHFVNEDTGAILIVIFMLLMIVPFLAVSVRRMHDQGKGGGWIFISYVPVVGGIWYLVLVLTPGESGPNRFGPDPKFEESVNSR